MIVSEEKMRKLVKRQNIIGMIFLGKKNEHRANDHDHV